MWVRLRLRPGYRSGYVGKDSTWVSLSPSGPCLYQNHLGEAWPVDNRIGFDLHWHSPSKPAPPCRCCAWHPCLCVYHLLNIQLSVCVSFVLAYKCPYRGCAQRVFPPIGGFFSDESPSACLCGTYGSSDSLFFGANSCFGFVWRVAGGCVRASILRAQRRKITRAQCRANFCYGRRV